MMNWDDYRVFLAVARRQKLALAALDLKLDETTISRRLKRLEDKLGQTLFERLRVGHELTAIGEALMSKAEEMERQVSIISETPLNARKKPSGVLRISVAEGFGAQVLSPILGNFSEAYPDIEIDLVSGSGFLSLSRREADVAIGLKKPKSRQIASEILSSYTLHLYASEAYVRTYDPIIAISDLSQHTLIDYVDDLIFADELRYFQDAIPFLRPKIRSTSILAQKNLVETGAGLAILPDFLVSENLVPVLKNEIHITRQFWYSSHQSVASLAKVKAFKNFTFLNLKSSFF